MAMKLYQPVGATDTDLAYLDTGTLQKFAKQAEGLAEAALRDNPSSAAVIITMGKGGVNPAAKLFVRGSDASTEFYELNNSGAFDAGLIYLAGRAGTPLWNGVWGPIPHVKPSLVTKFRSAAPWIILGALGIAGTVYYTRRTIKRRRAAKGG